MGDGRGGAVRLRGLGVLGVVVGLAVAPAGVAGADPALTKERLYALARERSYGTPVALDLSARWATPTRITDSGYVIGSGGFDTESGVTQVREFRWHDGVTELLPEIGENPRIVDVNERGQVLAATWWDGQGYQEPFVWEPDGSVVELSDVARWRTASGINDHGLVVGLVDEDRVPATWQDGTLTRLPTPEGEYLALSANGDTVNDRGEFVGTMLGGEHPWRAYVWRDGVPHELPVEGSARSAAERINERGDVLGYVDSADGKGHVLWEGGERRRWVDKAARYGLDATDLNERGVVVGNATTHHLRGPVRSNERGVALPLPGLGAKGGTVAALHDTLDLAVGSAHRPGDANPHAVAWVLTVPVPLGEQLDGRRMPISQAVDVNAHGQVVGWVGLTDWQPRVVVWDLRKR